MFGNTFVPSGLPVTNWMDYTPITSGSGGMTFTITNKVYSKYRLFPTLKMCEIKIFLGGTLGAASSNKIYVSTPPGIVSAGDDANARLLICQLRDGTAITSTVVGSAYVAGNTIYVYNSQDTNLNLGVNAYFLISGFFQYLP